MTPGLVPYITAREGEETDLLSSLCVRGPSSATRIGYRDEIPSDLGPRGELWGRCSQRIGPDRMPIGRPLWRQVHPARQRETMMKLRCQVCVAPARTAKGTLFLESAAVKAPAPGSALLTAHPPVCLPHARASVEQCAHFAQHGARVLLVRSAPLYGVMGTGYKLGLAGWQEVPGVDAPVPYGSPVIRAVLASQLVRELRDFTVVQLDELE
ncbi:hypothetical protein [Streptomyces sp. NPDC058620]|uniref:hypothetical protein n=1 Tax=Streptomyces sp. NPDC058620 TaxID=3346560 RepID=UPI0036528437